MLAFGCRGREPLSAQLVFNVDRTLKTMECSHSLAETSRFLAVHPGALVFSEVLPNEGECWEMLRRLISEGSPAAWIALDPDDGGRVSARITIYRNHEILRDLFSGSEIIRAIALGWRWCKEAESLSAAPVLIL